MACHRHGGHTAANLSQHPRAAINSSNQMIDQRKAAVDHRSRGEPTFPVIKPPHVSTSPIIHPKHQGHQSSGAAIDDLEAGLAGIEPA